MPSNDDRFDDIRQQAASDQSDNIYDPPTGFRGSIGLLSDSELEEREVYNEIWDGARNAK